METILKILYDEHQNILKVIDALIQECNSIESGNKIDKEFLKKTIEFIKDYADNFHHSKEENILFIELSKDEVQMHCNPIPQMLHEHDLGRNFIKELENGVEENDKDKIIENARAYAQLLQEHISKEDNILYPMADELLSSNIKNNIFKKFQEVEQKLIEKKKKYLLFLKEIKERK